MAEVRQQQDINRIGHSRRERQHNAEGIDRAARINEQDNAERAQERTEKRAFLHLFAQHKAAEHHDDRIGKVEHRRHAGGKIAVRAEKQNRRKPAAEKAGQTGLKQRTTADAQPALLLAQQREDREREEIAQKHQCHRRHALRIEKVRPQRHTAKDHGAQNHAEIAEPRRSTFHDSPPPLYE